MEHIVTREDRKTFVILLIITNKFMASCTFIHFKISRHLYFCIMWTCVLGHSWICQNVSMAPNDNRNYIPFGNALSCNQCIFFANERV